MELRTAVVPPPPIDAAGLVSALGRGLPDGRLLVDPDVLAAISHDDAEWAPVGRAVAGVRAETEGQVRHVVRVCAEFGAPIVPRGAGTGLSGGANATDGSVVLDLSRMNQVLEIDRDNMICVVQPGDSEQRPEGRRRRARPVVPAGPGERPLVVDRRERGHQRGRPVLPEVRRYPGLRARAARGDGRPGSAARDAAGTAMWSGSGRRTTKGVAGLDLTACWWGPRGRSASSPRSPSGFARRWPARRARSWARSAAWSRLGRGGVADHPPGPVPVGARDPRPRLPDRGRGVEAPRASPPTRPRCCWPGWTRRATRAGTRRTRSPRR